jgi:ribosomal protein L3 glutamine methyltransferase
MVDASTHPSRPPGDDEIIDALRTPRDYLRLAVSRFNAAGLVFGHGATNAFDEAAYLVLEGLLLPIDQLDPFLDARLTRAERIRLLGLIEARVTTRKPIAYLLNRAYIGGVPFYVDERVIVPRSFIGEMLIDIRHGDSPLSGEFNGAAVVLDLCTGGGSLAILAAMAFEDAVVDAVDASADALDVARRNVGEFGFDRRIRLLHGDLFAPVEGRRYDLIVTNPPYVTSAAVDAFPPEFAAEPRLAHEGGADGLTIVRRILADAGRHLTQDGALICEVGQERPDIMAEFPSLPMTWLDTRDSEGEVFLIHARDLAAKEKPKRRR